jgi:hypothetical protein
VSDHALAITLFVVNVLSLAIATVSTLVSRRSYLRSKAMYEETKRRRNEVQGELKVCHRIWFAWYPVRLGAWGTGRWAWFERVLVVDEHPRMYQPVSFA